MVWELMVISMDSKTSIHMVEGPTESMCHASETLMVAHLRDTSEDSVTKAAHPETDNGLIKSALH